MRGERDPRSDEEGFSLVEVLVSLALLTTMMAALAPFFVHSFQSVAQQRGRQAAVELANGAVEQVRALRGSALVIGRSRLRSTEQWQDAYDHGPAAMKAYLAAPGRPVTGPTTMKLAWDAGITDPESTLGDDAAISTATQTMTVERTAYSRGIYVGECDIYLGGSGRCVNPDVVTRPSDSTKDLQFYRVVVLVTWPGRGCAPAPCHYLTSTLISRAADEPMFDIHRPAPVVKTGTVTLYQGVASAYQLEATGGQLPNTWTVGALPAGLTMSPAGVVGGTPATLGTSTTTATVTDKLGRSDSETVTFRVVLPLTVAVAAGARNHVGEAVSRQVTAAGGVPPYTYTATGLPDGLALDFHTGGITGTLATAGTYPVAVTATDANGGTATGSYTHTVDPVLRLDALADQSIDLGSAVTATAVAQGGDGTYTYSASGLPPGVLLDASTGVLSHAPDSGRYLSTVAVTDGLGRTAADTFVLTVNTSSSLVFTAPGFAAADQTSAVGSTVSLAVATNADLLNLKPKIDDTGLPDGLKLSPSKDVIYGTPTTAGIYRVTLVASDAKSGQTSTLILIWTIR